VDASDALLLKVDDDGAGLPDAPGRHAGGNGMGNMAARAEKLGGRFSIEAASPHGTSLTWRVPLS